jgi:hypothetical protein
MSNEIREETAPRIFFDEAVTIMMADREEPVMGRALNLSEGGIYVCAPEQLSSDVRVTLQFCLPDGDFITTPARVIRAVTPKDPVEPAGMAMCFEDLPHDHAERIHRFISSRLQPATGEAVRLELGELGTPIAARTQSYWDRFLAVDAELPFLRLGSGVSYQFTGGQKVGGNGCIRWVSVHVPPSTGVPRLNIGIELSDDCPVVEVQEEVDPVCNGEFTEHSKEVDKEVRAERRKTSSRQAAAAGS